MPDELKGIIGLCEIFIGKRMHANIAALSQNIPTISLAWSHKFYGLMQMVGQEKYIIDYRHLKYENIVDMINELWISRKKIKEELQIAVVIQKQKVNDSVSIMKDIIEKYQIE
jgi:colanic acid/amylovoran biosynthesis protein